MARKISPSPRIHLDITDYFPKVLKILNVFILKKKKNYKNQILGAGLILHFLVYSIEAYLIIRILCPFPEPLPWYKSLPWTQPVWPVYSPITLTALILMHIGLWSFRKSHITYRQFIDLKQELKTVGVSKIDWPG